MRLSPTICSSLLALALSASGEGVEKVRFIAFSPNGRTVAFTVGDGACKLFLRGTDGSAPATTMTATADLAEPRISWSPDSRWLAYTSDRAGSWDIWAWDTEAGKSSRITRHLAKDHLATFWPGASTIFFVSTRGRQPDLWRVDMNGGEPTQTTNDADAESDLSVSADGSVFVYRATDAEGQSKIVARSHPQGAVASFVPPKGSLGPLRVAPNGKALAFVSEEGLYVADLSRKAIGEPKLIVKRTNRHATMFDWSPDSDAILASDGQCLIRRRLGWFGREKRLATPQFGATLPAWHPDGRRFAYAGYHWAMVALSPLRAPQTRHWSVEGIDLYEPRQDECDSAPTPPLEASAKSTLPLLSAWNKEIVWRLTDQSDADTALAIALKLPELIVRYGHEADQTALAEALHRCVVSFDRAGLFDSANQALRTLLPLLKDGEGLGSFLMRQRGHLIRLLSPTPFVECKLGHLPKWLDARAEIVLGRVEAVAEPDGRGQLSFALRLLRAWRPTDVEKLLKPIAEQWEARSTSDETRHMLTAGYYVLANFYQTRRSFAQALDYYDKLLRVVRDEGIRAYAPVLAECREFLPRRLHIVRQWLELERAIAHGPWQLVSFIASAPGQEDWGGLSRGDARKEGAACAAAAGYEEFLRKYGKTSLADDAALRVIELSSGSRVRAMKAERFLVDRPSSRLFPAVLNAYVEASRQQHTPWLAAMFLTDLTKKPDHIRHLPLLRATIGDVRPRAK